MPMKQTTDVRLWRPGGNMWMLTSSMVSRMALGLPGMLRMRALPLSPAVCRESTAVGTYLQLAYRNDRDYSTNLLHGACP